MLDPFCEYGPRNVEILIPVISNGQQGISDQCVRKKAQHSCPTVACIPRNILLLVVQLIFVLKRVFPYKINIFNLVFGWGVFGRIWWDLYLGRTYLWQYNIIWNGICIKVGHVWANMTSYGKGAVFGVAFRMFEKASMSCHRLYWTLHTKEVGGGGGCYTQGWFKRVWLYNSKINVLIT